jgi:hypothetical protein
MGVTNLTPPSGRSPDGVLGGVPDGAECWASGVLGVTKSMPERRNDQLDGDLAI